MTARHRFAFDTSYRLPAALVGVTPWTAWVEIDDAGLRVRFGPWRLRTPLGNIEGLEVTSDYGFLTTVGPAHLSLSDRGVTFATNRRRGLCVRFRDPVRSLDPLGLLRHPGATMTVAEPEALHAEVERLRLR